MNVLYTGAIYGPLRGTCFQRMIALRDFGANVAPVCVVPYALWGGKYLGLPFRRLMAGPPIALYNREILRTVARHQADLVWVDKGTWVKPETITEIQHRYGAKVVHYTPDPALVFHKSRHFLESVPRYDLVVTTKAYEQTEYKKRGVRELLIQLPSYDKRAHYPVLPTSAEKEKFTCDVVFVGSYADGREKWLEPAAEAGVDLAIWGAGWEHCRSPLLQPHIKHQPVFERAYPLSLGCARIGLGALSPLVPDRSTTRSLEIPACGTFLLAERTEEHQRLFQEGVEAEFFSTPEELKRKIKHYLQHEDARETIAAAGYRRCQEDSYSSHHKVLEILECLQDKEILKHPFLDSMPGVSFL